MPKEIKNPGSEPEPPKDSKDMVVFRRIIEELSQVRRNIDQQGEAETHSPQVEPLTMPSSLHDRPKPPEPQTSDESLEPPSAAIPPSSQPEGNEPSSHT